MARGDEDIEGGSENELSLMQFKLFSFFKPACVDLFTEKTFTDEYYPSRYFLHLISSNQYQRKFSGEL